jgi:hypothetical protein
MTSNLWEQTNGNQTAFLYTVASDTPSQATTYRVTSPLAWLPSFETSTLDQAEKVMSAIETLSDFAITNQHGGK